MHDRFKRHTHAPRDDRGQLRDGWRGVSLTGMSRDLLYDEMRRGNLTYVKVGRHRLITRYYLQQFLGDVSS